MSETLKGPLQGVRVIDLTTVMLGPFCTQILGEMGADVIKIEPPGGDIGRWTGAFKTKGMSSAYLMKGRNKRSVVLDLKKAEAKGPLKRLVESALPAMNVPMASSSIFFTCSLDLKCPSVARLLQMRQRGSPFTI